MESVEIDYRVHKNHLMDHIVSQMNPVHIPTSGGKRRYHHIQTDVPITRGFLQAL
jgi:hypothetical protein